ncbi:hypothetical protein PILCRDRAFT_4230 [Piloderma croceum F 1598]|uniref:Uncharacterized protein n=1 Tax=Piloderma croceum (strain F 1598) TaxID=765440 RepID=A0A0C3FS86_PILCF|nr:hypothetical protein PILCRDRAFT_4230 [Piloderma croceum F 1598]
MLSAPKLKIQTAPFSSIIAGAMIYEFGHGELLAITSVVVDPPMLNDQRKRPTSAEGRIQPCAIQGHRVSHRMLGPCCLCPMMDTTKPDYIEAAIYKASTGEQAGRYVASCAKDACGYFVPLEDLYDKPCPTKYHRHRDSGERVPPKVAHVSEIHQVPSTSRRSKRSGVMSGIKTDAILQRRPPVMRPSHKTANLLAKLDARERPGIPEVDFMRLFRKCECGYVMTHRASRDHDCLNKVVDLASKI